MNILLIHNKYAQFGGEDKIVEQQIELLKRKGHDVTFYGKFNGGIKDHSIIKKLKLIKNGYFNKDVMYDLEQLIVNKKPDIAHVHNVFPLISPGVYKFLSNYNIPIVQTLHNYRFVCPNGLLYNNHKICIKCLEKNNVYSCFFGKCYHDSYLQSLWYADVISKSWKKGYFNKINWFVALNPFMKDVMVQGGFSEERIIIIPNFVDDPNVKLLFKKKDYFIFIGRLSEEKGINYLLETMKKNKDINLKIVGDGPLKEYVYSYISNNNLKNVDLIGFRSGQEKVELISNAKAILVPSLWYENFPTVVLEAFALGTPIIASRIGGLQYMINDGINGFLINLDDLDDFTNKLRLINDNENLIKQLSINARETYEEKYSPEIFYNKIYGLYQSLKNNCL